MNHRIVVAQGRHEVKRETRGCCFINSGSVRALVTLFAVLVFSPSHMIAQATTEVAVRSPGGRVTALNHFRRASEALHSVVGAHADGQKRHTIPLRLERDKSLIDVSIGSAAIPRILLDTGFAFDGLMIYNPAYLDSIDLSGAVEMRIRGAGGGEGTTALVIDSVDYSLGDVQMLNQRVIVLREDTYKGFPSNGIIGYSVFGHYVCEFNYDAATMILHEESAPVDDSWSAIPLYFKNNNIPWLNVAVVIDDDPPVSLASYIDFAAGDAIVLLEKPGMKFHLPKDTVDYYIGKGLSGDIYGKRGTISKLIIGPYELEHVTAAIADAGLRSKQKNADAVLSHAALQRFNLMFDYAKKTLYVKPNAQFSKAFE
jgi:hypothetical protein